MTGQLGQRKRSPHSGDVERDRMWRSMRHMRRFTSADIQATADAGYDNTKKFIAALAKAEYLRCVQPYRSGEAGGHAVWQLVKNTGPITPRLSAEGVYDANVVHSHESHGKRVRRHALAAVTILLSLADAEERCDDKACAAATGEARAFAARWRAGE